MMSVDRSDEFNGGVQGRDAKLEHDQIWLYCGKARRGKFSV